MHVHQTPPALLLPIYLRLAALGRQRSAVLPELSRKIPIELRPRGVSVRVDRDIFNAELPLGESLSHQLAKDMVRHRVETVLMPARVNERHLRRIRPDLPDKFHVGRIDGFRILRQQALDLANIRGRAAILARSVE